MRAMEGPLPSPAMIEEDIARLEVGIRQLKRQYDMFFAGALDHEPIELRSRLQRLIRRYSDTPIQKYAHRFHFNAMVSRFNSLSELWSKTMRCREEGDRRNHSLADRYQIRERLLARCRVNNGQYDEEALHRLHKKFTEARRAENGGKKPVSYEKFVKGISNQTRRLQKESGCAEIELRVVISDQEVQVKARPGK